jgi:2-haloacid dehalogenase
MKPTIIFDLGGVLIDWNPRHFYSTVFEHEHEMEHFLQNIATSEWNELQDAGRTLEEATNILCLHFPEYERLIRLYYSEWKKMLKGPIQPTVNLLKALKEQDYRLLALTNWSDETFPVALEMYEFLGWFEGILVSGKEKLKKPDPAIFKLLIKRYQLNPAASIFIDDNLKNIEAAGSLGIDAIHFKSADDLAGKLRDRGIQV